MDTEYAGIVSAFDTEFLAAYDSGSSPRREFFRANGKRLIAEYNRLAAFIDKRRSALDQQAGPVAAGVARQEALSMAAYIAYQSAADMRAYAETRDEAMFRNLRYLADERFPGEKIIVWGHNYHLRHDNATIPPSAAIFPGVAARSMGTWARQHFGARVFTIGQYEATGAALDNARKPYVISAPADGTLEQRLQKMSNTPALVDIRAGVSTTEGAWLGSALTARYNGQHPEVLVPSRQYDAILMLPSVTPPAFLY